MSRLSHLKDGYEIWVVVHWPYATVAALGQPDSSVVTEPGASLRHGCLIVIRSQMPAVCPQCRAQKSNTFKNQLTPFQVADMSGSYTCSSQFALERIEVVALSLVVSWKIDDR